MAQTLVSNAALLDLDRAELRPGTSVLIEDERIVELSDREISAPDARPIDAGGRALLPGLIDAHVHVIITTMNLASLQSRPITLVAQEARVILEGMLRRGFTTVRDAGGADWGLAEAVDRDLISGPGIFYSGRTLSQTGGHGDFRARDETAGCACQIYSTGFSHVVDGVDAVRKAAREELRRGANQIKIMASGGVASPTDPIWNTQFSPDEMRAAVEEAQGWRTYAMAHAYLPDAIQRAIDAGVRTIEHGNLIDRETAALMVKRKAFLVPTLVTYYKIDELGRALGFPANSQRKVRDVLDAGLASLEIARDAGLPMGFGTDLLGETHEHQSEEFRIRGEVLSPIEVIRSATRVNAQILGRSDELGELKVGARADLILVDGDPLRQIALLAEPHKHFDLIMKDGVAVVDRLA